MDAFIALADHTRRAILLALVAGPQRVVDLANPLPISRPAVSKHLRLLGEAGLVVATPHGRETHYALAADGLAPVDRFLAQLTPATLPASTLDALGLEVRRTTRERTSERRATPTTTKETA